MSCGNTFGSSNPQFKHVFCVHLRHRKIVKTTFHLTLLIAPNREAANHLEKRRKDRSMSYRPHFLCFVCATCFYRCLSVYCPFPLILSIRTFVGLTHRLRRAEGTKGAENSPVPLAPECFCTGGWVCLDDRGRFLCGVSTQPAAAWLRPLGFHETEHIWFYSKALKFMRGVQKNPAINTSGFHTTWLDTFWIALLPKASLHIYFF